MTRKGLLEPLRCRIDKNWATTRYYPGFPVGLRCRRRGESQTSAALMSWRWLDAPSIAEGSPHPLDRTEAKTAQPQRTRDRLSGIDTNRKQNAVRCAHVAELAQSPAVEDEAQDERLREI